jgi:hypothetical protein
MPGMLANDSNMNSVSSCTLLFIIRTFQFSTVIRGVVRSEQLGEKTALVRGLCAQQELSLATPSQYLAYGTVDLSTFGSRHDLIRRHRCGYCRVGSESSQACQFNN